MKYPRKTKALRKTHFYSRWLADLLNFVINFLDLHQFCLTKNSKYGLVGTDWNAICRYFASIRLYLALLFIMSIFTLEIFVISMILPDILKLIYTYLDLMLYENSNTNLLIASFSNDSNFQNSKNKIHNPLDCDCM